MISRVVLWLQKTRNKRLLVIVVILVVGVYAMVVSWNPPIQTVEGLAWCLKQKGVVMVDMKDICRECEEQKKDFGQYVKYLTVIDCSTRALRCEQLGFSTYPVWQFPDQQPLIGRQNLRDLGVYAGCPIASRFPLQ